MRRAAAAVLLCGAAIGAAGCDRVFGLDRRMTDGGFDAAPTFTVTGRTGFYLSDVTSDGSPQPFADQLVPPNAHVVLDDDREVPITVDADSTWSFPTEHAGQLFRFAFETQFTTAPQEIDEALASIVDTPDLFGRLNRVAPAAGTQLAVTTTLAATSTSVIYIASTGLRTFSGRPNGNAASFTLPWMSPYTGSSSGSLGLLDATRGDRVWVLENTAAVVPVGTPNPNAYEITTAGSAAITMTNGMSTPVSVTMKGAAALGLTPRCATIAANRGTELARIQPQIANSNGAPIVAYWHVQSTPFPDQTPVGGLPLAFAIDSASAPVSDSHAVTWFDPFSNEGEIAVVVTYLGHTFQLPGTTAQTEYSGTVQYLPIDAPACPTGPTVSFAATVAMPSPATLGGVAVVTDNQQISIARDARVPLTFKPSAAGTADDYVVSLYEIYATPAVGVSPPLTANTTEFRLQKTFIVNQPEVDLDPSELIVGKAYAVVMEARVGYPNAATGDYKTIAYPFAVGIQWSPIFHVMS
jgi:hypothetical protein